MITDNNGQAFTAAVFGFITVEAPASTSYCDGAVQLICSPASVFTRLLGVSPYGSNAPMFIAFSPSSLSSGNHRA